MKKAFLAANVSASWWRVLGVFGTSELQVLTSFLSRFVELAQRCH